MALSYEDVVTAAVLVYGVVILFLLVDTRIKVGVLIRDQVASRAEQGALRTALVEAGVIERAALPAPAPAKPPGKPPATPADKLPSTKRERPKVPPETPPPEAPPASAENAEAGAEQAPATRKSTAPEARTAVRTSDRPPPAEEDAIEARYRVLCEQARAAGQEVGHCDKAESGCELGDEDRPTPVGVASEGWRGVGAMHLCGCNCAGCRRVCALALRAQRDVMGPRFPKGK